MKGLMISFLIISIGTFGQTNEKRGTIKIKKPQTETQDTIIPITLDTPTVVFDQQPKFPGGHNEMNKFIQNNIKYPKAKKRAGISDTCTVTFIVKIDGTLSRIKIYKGIPKCHRCDLEALRVVNLMPKWIPAKEKGASIQKRYYLPIDFDLK